MVDQWVVGVSCSNPVNLIEERLPAAKRLLIRSNDMDPGPEEERIRLGNERGGGCVYDDDAAVGWWVGAS